MLSVLEKAACLPHYHTAQYKQRDHIRDRHQTVKDIRDGPYCFYGMYGPMNTAKIYSQR